MGAKNNDAGKKNENDANKKKENGESENITAVLKADLHCDGCATKFLKCIRSFDGVKALTIDDTQKITVTGKFDPAKLRDKVEEKTHKKVELISPGQPKKNDNNNNNNKKENAKVKENEKEEKNTKNKNEGKKSKDKEPPVTTAILKMHLHCEGCIQKIHKIVSKTKGYQEMKIDRQKDLVTVTGAIDVKALAETLKRHLKKEVEILPPKKEGGGDKKKEGGGDKEKNSGTGGDGGADEDGGEKKGKGGGGGGGGEKGKKGGGNNEEDGGKERMEGNKMQVHFGDPYPYMYGPGQVGEQFQYYNPNGPYGPYHAPQIFSDENPNACSVM